MEERILFRKGKQRDFLNECIRRLNCLSLRGILQFGLSVKYNSLKNYYSERRLLPKSLFHDLLYLIKMNEAQLKYKIIFGNWGQIKGGRHKKSFKPRK